jgi:uncharacterized protein YdeI (YjbR/CyaY-like superfamily)
VEVRTEHELHEWLEHHHTHTEAVWLVTWKKPTQATRAAETPPTPSSDGCYIPHETVLDHLVAFGWIDGIRRRLDDTRSIQLISPRRTRPWAKSYKDRAERLIATGRMHPAGLADVEHAKHTGAWDAMNDVDALVVPDDLTAALAAHPPAANHFARFPASTRRNILRWIASARTSLKGPA